MLQHLATHTNVCKTSAQNYAENNGIFMLKVWYVIKKKNFIKLSRGQVPKQTGSQSPVRGMSTHDMEERAFGAQNGY